MMKLKKIRKEKGFTQEQIADSLNISRVTLSNIENGKSRLDAVQLYKLSQLYGVEPFKLIGIEKQKPVKFAFRESEKLSKRANKKLEKIEKYINKIVELESL
ncbi:MAG: helix-turn-helix transcriptional regulator [Candidatus Cloacimonetes bacterium]|nr:helix-turn-helix transcriptional regulator [Candidatus Cloacimonadota bacterium]